MIRIATVFSGIGAIEHALERMQLEHEIVFACDNGDIDILTKEVAMNVDDIQDELNHLDEVVEQLHLDDDVQDIYKEQLIGMLREANLEYAIVIDKIKSLESNNALITEVLNAISKMPNVKPVRVKEYKMFEATLKVGSKEQNLFKELQVILKITNDYKRDNSFRAGSKYRYLLKL